MVTPGKSPLSAKEQKAIYSKPETAPPKPNLEAAAAHFFDPVGAANGWKH
jgi:hypothetical protein